MAGDAGTTWVSGTGRAGPLKRIPLRSKANCSETMDQNGGVEALGKYEMFRLATG